MKACPYCDLGSQTKPGPALWTLPETKQEERSLSSVVASLMEKKQDMSDSLIVFCSTSHRWTQYFSSVFFPLSSFIPCKKLSFWQHSQVRWEFTTFFIFLLCLNCYFCLLFLLALLFGSFSSLDTNKTVTLESCMNKSFLSFFLKLSRWLKFKRGQRLNSGIFCRI